MITSNHDRFTTSREIVLFCFPYAGGACYAYKEFDRHITDAVRLTAFDLPGHGKRMQEPLLTDIDEMVEDLFYQIKTDLHGPYAFYGHSLGANLAYLLAKKIREEKLPGPARLFLSGRAGPAVETKEKNYHLLPREEFLEKITAYGGTPEEVLAEKELMELMEPILRADFQAVASFRHDNAILLDAPITVMIGSNDNVTHQEAMKWREVTRREITVKQFPGKHFFIFDHLPEIGGMISSSLEIGNWKPGIG
ncbi:MAG: thioesterase [Desulfobacterales bacterium]|nr:thioesterase [Desulfobacterales bacterium]